MPEIVSKSEIEDEEDSFGSVSKATKEGVADGLAGISKATCHICQFFKYGNLYFFHT